MHEGSPWGNGEQYLDEITHCAPGKYLSGLWRLHTKLARGCGSGCYPALSERGARFGRGSRVGRDFRRAGRAVGPSPGRVEPSPALPVALLKYLKNFESGLSKSRVSRDLSAAS